MATFIAVAAAAFVSSIDKNGKKTAKKPGQKKRVRVAKTYSKK